MKCGFYVTTPQAEFIAHVQLMAAMAMYDALARGPVCFCRLS